MELKYLLVIYIIIAAVAVSIYLIFFLPKAETSQTTSKTTTTSSSITLPQPDASWSTVVGYTQSFNICRDICQQYQLDCKVETAKQYCSTVIAVDLNRDGTIQNSRGFTPRGGGACENSLRCFDIIAECKCSRSVLDVGTCINSYLEQPVTSECSMPSA